MEINKYIDQTNISLEAKAEDIIKTCQEAKDFHFRGVCVNPQWVKLAKKELSGSGIKVVVLIDPPIGDSKFSRKISSCKQAKKEGADELDVVISVPDVKHGNWPKVLNDLKKICKIQDTKVIIGSGYLTDEEIKKCSETVKEAGAICVKTATSKDPLENREMEEKARHIRIMKEAAPGIMVKASGNIKTLNDAKMMIGAGADIIGTSSGVSMVSENNNV